MSSRIHEIKDLYDRGEYRKARELCLQGIYECREDAFLHSGTGFESARDAELKEYETLKNKVSFQEIRDFFNRKTRKSWNPDMTAKLNDFVMLVKKAFNNDRQAFQAHQKNIPGSSFFSEYKHLAQGLDDENIRAKAPEIIAWLKSLPIANNPANELQTSIFQQAQTPMAESLQGKPPVQLSLFPSQPQ